MSFKMNYMCSSWAIFDHNLDGVVDNINHCGLMVLVTRGSKEGKGVHPALLRHETVDIELGDSWYESNEPVEVYLFFLWFRFPCFYSEAQLKAYSR